MVISSLRRLLNVKTIKLVMYGKWEGKNRRDYCSFVSGIMKEDYYQRYDAPGAPNIEATWRDWHLNKQENLITLQAHAPKPVLPEEEYVLLMKPKVDALMADAEKVTGPYPADLNYL